MLLPPIRYRFVLRGYARRNQPDGGAILAGFLKCMAGDHDGSGLVQSHGNPALISIAVLLIEF